MDDVYGRAGHDRAMISHSVRRKDEGSDSGEQRGRPFARSLSAAQLAVR
jgi:hypothetical protein